MDTIGITVHGPPNPLGDSMSPNYQESRIRALTAETTLPKTLKEFPSKIDVYLGDCDGYSHDSLDLLKRTRRKGFYKPVGPIEMHRLPVTTSMDLGWFLGDPALRNADWTRMRERFPLRNSDETRYLHAGSIADKMVTHTNQL